MNFPIHIALRRSHRLNFSLYVFHILAAISVLVLPWLWVLRVVIVAFLGVSFWRALQPSVIRGLRLSERGEVDCLNAEGTRIAASVYGDSTVFSWMVVLRLRLDEQDRTVVLVLLPDSMSTEQFRLLRLFLRWRVATRSDEAIAAEDTPAEAS